MKSSNDAVHILFLSLQGLGTFVNVWILACMYLFPPPNARHEGRMRLNVVIALLIAVCLSHSVCTLAANVSPDYTRSYWAYANNFNLCSLFAMNICVAIERYGAIATLSQIKQRRHYEVIGGTALLVYISIIPMLLFAPSSSGLSPLYGTVYCTVYFYIITVYYIFSCIATAVWYFFCHKRIKGCLDLSSNVELSTIKKDIEVHLQRPGAQSPNMYNGVMVKMHQERYRQTLERMQSINLKMIRNCSLMGGGIFVLYFPYFLNLHIYPYLDSAAQEGMTSFAKYFALLDILWTPAIVLFFSPEIRRACLLNMVKEVK
ncbi:hypothetical protein BJ741DRAFT_627178 [Chytriomyces cf. hyalinus JEL632]|nr:hypothetical protein BJ741DRAFT_627178 [Chytriomyces cf. hyalinus JEL632]